MKQEIGRIDRADFPALELFDIEVKVDTGDYTSSIHCKNVKVENGLLKCNFLDEAHPNYHEKEFTFKNFDLKIVKSSNGIAEPRYRIKTKITIFGQTYDIFLTLSDREEEVLRLRFGLDDGKARTLEEVGQHFEVTRERIRQIEAKALRKLRHPSRSSQLRDFLD